MTGWLPQLLLTLAALYLVFAAGMAVFQRSLLYLPDRSVPTAAAAGVPDMTTVALRTEDGLDLAAWYRPATAARPTLVYLHGNGGHIGYRGGRARPFLDDGYGVLLVEYRGYGGNPGRPSERGLYADGRAALAFLGAAGVPARNLVLYGESLGSGVAVRLAAERAEAGRPVGAVVLEAPLSSATDIAAFHYPYLPVRWLLLDRFDAVSAVGAIAAPLLIIHGDADGVVPVRFGRRLFDAAAEPKEGRWISTAGHEDLHRFGLAGMVDDFLVRHRLAADAPAAAVGVDG
jgi:hypothetical protein